jgi:hypothetical protein
LRVLTICASVKRLLRIGWISLLASLGRKSTIIRGLDSGAQALFTEFIASKNRSHRALSTKETS